ncbi:MAG: cation transporter [Sphingomonas bacterium]|uniref:cation diffusion facilitator family transporter n=1 Tax=Sphingomonas bacterium TaxID=1895847 RepID=UPI002610B41F|nr:cation diffusion facilitator family transporter [Sphingomonas bacterium]MDB5695078.1 cation transporter [Sphingomonas bacterium]
MGHGHHHHGHDHAHAHAPASFDRAFAWGIALNLAYVLCEATAGLWWGSMALLADAGHNLSDVMGLGVAWAGAALARKPATKRFTYGFKSSTILAAMINALLLMVALGAIVLEATRRLIEPAAIAGPEIAVVAAIGIAINGFTAWLFARGRHGDVNIRGAYLHMLSDAVVSAGVVVAGLAIWWTGAGWIDPLTSFVIAGVIFWQTAGLLRETVEMALQAVPRDLDYDKVRMALRVLPGVERVHHLHIWPMSTTEPVLTAHLVMPGGMQDDAFLRAAQAMLREEYGIGHATLQVERGDVGDGC